MYLLLDDMEIIRRHIGAQSALFLVKLFMSNMPRRRPSDMGINRKRRRKLVMMICVSDRHRQRYEGAGSLRGIEEFQEILVDQMRSVFSCKTGRNKHLFFSDWRKLCETIKFSS